MREYATLPIERLGSDVAVDPVHVRELADSIKVSGPISPVLVRQETLDLIDGFHRVAAMGELGFKEVECILTPCDDETFWDLRIMSATLHKAVTFARAVDWVDEAFHLSPWQDRYASAHGLFHQSHDRRAPTEVQEWATAKAQKWGLAIVTIRDWLDAKNTMAPELREEMNQLSARSEPRPTSDYVEVARRLRTRPDLQKAVLDKVEDEGLGRSGIRAVATAIHGAADEDEVKTILSQPVSRTADDLTRAARVEKLLREPAPEPTPRQQERQFTGRVLEVYLDLQQQVHNVRGLEPEMLQTLSPDQKAEFLQVVAELTQALHQVSDVLGGAPQGAVIEGRLVESR